MTADSQKGRQPADVAESSARHPAAWRFLLPRRADGPVVLANLDPITTENLLRSYPAAVVLSRSVQKLNETKRVVLWDGQRSPLRPGSVALVVCDDRDRACAEAVRPALADDGQQMPLQPAEVRARGGRRNRRRVARRHRARQQIVKLALPRSDFCNRGVQSSVIGR